MNNSISTTPSVPGGMPTWDNEKKLLSTRAWFRLLILLFIVLWLILIGWVLFSPIQDATALPLEVGANLTIVLAPDWQPQPQSSAHWYFQCTRAAAYHGAYWDAGCVG
jgi:hypothetical protein